MSRLTPTNNYNIAITDNCDKITLMYIITNGLIINQHGELLLVRRADNGMWAVPGGSMSHGETPPESVTRELFEETGLKTHPVRLVGLTYWERNGTPFLLFSFRCIQRNNQFQTSSETIGIDFFSLQKIPFPMIPDMRNRIEWAINHAEEQPRYEAKMKNPWWFKPLDRFNRGFFQLFHYMRHSSWIDNPKPTDKWDASTSFLIRNEQQELLWQKTETGWTLPTEQIIHATVPPWETAVTNLSQQTKLPLNLTHLIQISPLTPSHLNLLFQTEQVNTPLANNASYQFFPVDAPPAGASPAVVAQATNALSHSGPTSFSRY